MRTRISFGIAAGAVVALLAGCGGSGDQTAAAAKCLQNALANQVGGTGNNCADSTSSSLLQSGSGTKINVSCTHKNGNEYICDVTGPGTQSVLNGGTGVVQGGFYNVVFDGKTIVYQQASGGS